jgi:hypothetical protein
MIYNREGYQKTMTSCPGELNNSNLPDFYSKNDLKIEIKNEG